ncbi:MAG: lysylphosphatidylglycerol synthase transmembrane domain-containing protein [Candidatus Methanoperedens sp.]|nr:lysylphosphatidylglycerol synthase transmembrane domain-containing protein [Candidatus Methanoperedens sp.]
MKKYRMILQVIIGIVIIAIILYKIGIYDVISALKKTVPFYFIMACLAYLCLNLTLASRLGFLLAKIGYKLKFITIFFSHVGGMILSDITPGRSGYFLTPALLKKKAGTPITDGMACIFAPQAIELILKVGGAFAAIIYISSISGIQRDLLISVAIGASILMFAGILMLVISWKDENVSLNFLKRIPFLRNFTERILTFKERSIAIKGSINTILLLTVTGWFFAALHWFYLGKALGIELPYYVFFLLHPLLSILMFAPTPAGVGFLEVGTIGVLSLFGVSNELAIAFSILVRASMILVDLTGLKTVLASLKDIEL